MDYALNLGMRLDAHLELLWLGHVSGVVPELSEFREKADQKGMQLNVVCGEGKNVWEKVKRHLVRHPPLPLIAVGLREIGGKTKDETRKMVRAGIPITLISFKSPKTPTALIH
ncbi:MAG: hypothetical protein HW380_232 [Magnetococcales bacterium]|nr:hypothetical protein [Magnetococcales bacterium]